MFTSTEKSISTLDRVKNRFPNQKESIEALYENSPTFREICSDYEEMVIWLEDNSQPEKKASDMYHHAEELLKELEDEIMGCLKGRIAPVAMEHYQGAD